MSRRIEAEKLWRQLRRQGFAVERTHGGHMRITHPRMTGPVFASSTPSDWHSLRNLQATLRRALAFDERTPSP